MSDAPTGQVLRNTETGEVAVRTHFPADNPMFTRILWLIAHPNLGARNAPAVEVDGDEWVVLWAPEGDDGDAG